MSVSLLTAKEIRKSGREKLPTTPFMLFKHHNGDEVTLTIAANDNLKYWHAPNWLSLISVDRGSTATSVYDQQAEHQARRRR